MAEILVKDYPKVDVSVEICDHKNGAVATFTDNTDSRYINSVDVAEMYAFKNNFKVGCFASENYGDDNADLVDCENTGVIKHDVYFQNNYWKNPSTDAIEVIPDYRETAWTSAGVTAFGVVLGVAKLDKTPNQGQEMYDLTSGALGYDYTSDVAGASNQSELIGIIDNQKTWYFGLLGKQASAFSYRNGKDQMANSLIPYFLGGRNSDQQSLGSSANTFYGIGLGYDPNINTSVLRSTFISKESSFRYVDRYLTSGEAAADAEINTEIPATISNNGWFNNFSHWHDYYNNLSMLIYDRYLALVQTNIGVSDVYSCSYGDAISYMFLREISDRAGAQEKNNKVYVFVDVIDKFKSQTADGIIGTLPLTSVVASLSVKIDLTGTYLAGKNIKSNSDKLISLGSNEFIVQVPFTNTIEFQVVELFEAEDGYFDTSLPTATITDVSNVITVSASQNVKAVLFSKLTAETEVDYKVADRSNNFKTSHTFTSSVGNDYKIGIINEYGKLNLIDV